MDMTEREKKQATFWLRRWKLLGGMVRPRLNSDGSLSIELHRTVSDSLRVERMHARTAESLEQELRDNPKKHIHVAELVRQHLHAKSLEEKAQLGDLNRSLALVTGMASDEGTDGPPNAA